MEIEPIDFSRAIPVFPLPNCVLFPGVVQPLHIFEPRYREMMAEVLDSQGAIAMALLREGWEKDYYGSPAIHAMVCVGKVVAHEKVEDGKYNLLLHGSARAELVEECRKAPYRTAKLVVKEEKEAGPLVMHREILRRMLQETALKELTVTPTLVGLFEDAKMPTARLLDLLAYTFVQVPQEKQLLLEELDPAKRCEKVMRAMVGLAGQMDAAQGNKQAKSILDTPLSPN